ncbi:hypothetical protein M0802_005041 [Mischocyttarus mexicanus]|nr:hypothetical protein M0802_005041 [Mischocyttarus mexicanus]
MSGVWCGGVRFSCLTPVASCVPQVDEAKPHIGIIPTCLFSDLEWSSINVHTGRSKTNGPTGRGRQEQQQEEKEVVEEVEEEDEKEEEKEEEEEAAERRHKLSKMSTHKRKKVGVLVERLEKRILLLGKRVRTRSKYRDGNRSEEKKSQTVTSVGRETGYIERIRVLSKNGRILGWDKAWANLRSLKPLEELKSLLVGISYDRHDPTELGALTYLESTFIVSKSDKRGTQCEERKELVSSRDESCFQRTLKSLLVNLTVLAILGSSEFGQIEKRKIKTMEKEADSGDGGGGCAAAAGASASRC